MDLNKKSQDCISLSIKFTNINQSEMRSFASDNNSGVHPLVLQAIIDANKDHAVGYGDDPWSAEAERRVKSIFGKNVGFFILFNGTGANSVALQAVTRPFNSVICAETAHVFVDECGAPAKMTGSTFIPVSTKDGKLTPSMIDQHLKNWGECHHSQPKAVYISEASELGTVYNVNEVRAIADLLHKNNMYLHMDGARIANACVSLNCSLKELTADAGVDILSFGGTKNGMMMGESVISFRNELTENLKYIRKQSAQLASKQRYLAAQFIAYLDNDLWYENAKRANEMAQKLFTILSKCDGIHFTQKMETNQLFFTATDDMIERLKKHYFFYFWNEEKREVRLVTSWDTTEKDISDLAVLL